MLTESYGIQEFEYVMENDVCVFKKRKCLISFDFVSADMFKVLRKPCGEAWVCHAVSFEALEKRGPKSGQEKLLGG